MLLLVVRATRFTPGGEIRLRGERLEMSQRDARRWIALGYVVPIEPEGTDLVDPEAEGTADAARDTTLEGTRDTTIQPVIRPRRRRRGLGR